MPNTMIIKAQTIVFQSIPADNTCVDSIVRW